jgi:hypothetical protein
MLRSMRALRPWVLSLASLPAILPLFAAPASAGEIKWSGDTSYKNRNAAIAWGTGAAANAGFVVWENDRLGLLGRSLDASGNPSGPVVTLRANDPLPQAPGEGDVRLMKEPALSIDRTGRLFVAWTEEFVHIRTDFFFEDRQVLDRNVFVQTFDAAGRAVGAAARAHVGLNGFQAKPAVTRLATAGGADFALVAWDSDAGSGATEGVFAREFRFSSQAPVSGELVVATGAARRPALAAQGGAGLIAWEVGGLADARGLFARSFDSAGDTLGRVNRVSPTGNAGPSQVSLAATGAGYLAAWNNAVTVTRTRVLVRALGADGNPIGAQRPVSSNPARAESLPAIAARGEQVAVLWLYWGSSLVEGVLAVGLDKRGTPDGPEQWLNDTLPSGGANRPTLTITPQGDVVGVWQAPDSNGWSIRSAKLPKK